MKKHITLLVLFCSLAISCATDRNQPAISFYYWKTVFRLSSDEMKAIEHNDVEKLYIRYFDIELNNGKAVPVAPIIINELPRGVSIVPVVYIKNEVMLDPQFDADDLATKVLSYIEKINTKHSLRNTEIQLDCDWTMKSRQAYFKFIDSVKKLSGETISATIRLHQVKYLERTGVPNVDHGVLMYYNMGKISDDTTNSIYEHEIAQRYVLSLKTYPLPLRVALPIFSWGIHIRGHKVVGLLNKVNEGVFQDSIYFEPKPPHFFSVKKDGFVAGYYFQKGDHIKIESIKESDLYEMASDLSVNFSKKTKEIVFYDLDSLNLSRYENKKDIFKKVAASF